MTSLISRAVVPQKQAFLHDPDNGVYGDCHRTAIAVVLGRPRDSVPHFLHDNCSGEVFYKRVDEWLAQNGLRQIHFVVQDEMGYADFIYALDFLNPDVPFLLGGFSKTGVNHTVVCQFGKIVCDPSLTDAGIVKGMQPDGVYWATYIVADAHAAGIL